MEIGQQHGVVNECHHKPRKYIGSVLKFSSSISVIWFFSASCHSTAERVKVEEFLFGVANTQGASLIQGKTRTPAKPQKYIPYCNSSDSTLK